MTESLHLNSSGKPTISIAVAAFLIATQAFAQAPQHSVAGTVVNAQTGEPVKRALVQLLSFGGEGVEPLARQARTIKTFTDSGGAFRFEAVPANGYSISARKPEFTFAASADSSIDVHSSIEGLRLSLSPLGVIAGKVLDQSRQPVRGAHVIAVTVQIQDGLRNTKSDRNVITDDRGEYRFWNLSPGKYFIQAAGLGGGSVLFAGDTTPLYLADESFAPVYAGGGKSVASAHPIEIAAGTGVRADLSVVMEHAYNLRGALANFVPRRQVQFQLSSGEQEVTAGRVSVNGDTGFFQISSVVPGSYVLHASQADRTADLPLTIGNADVANLRVTLAGPVEVPVVTQFSTSPQISAPEGQEETWPGACMPRLNSADDWARPSGEMGIVEGVNKSGILKVRPGRYRVSINCFGGYVVSALSGSQDLLENPVLTVQAGSAAPPIEITATLGGATLTGTVNTTGFSGKMPAAVLLVPLFSRSTGPQVLQSFANPNAPGEAAFQIDFLAPGDYMAYAFAKAEGIEFRNPQYLTSLTNGTTVHVESGKPASVTITGRLQ